MLERDIVVSNKLGLHARASAKLVQLVQGFKSTVWLLSKGREVNAQSIMGVMMLAAGIGTPLTIRADGPDEQAALEAVITYQNRYKTAEPRIAVAEKRVAEVAKLKGKGWKVFENVLVFSDLALSFTDPGQYAKVSESLAGILPSVGSLAADKISKKVFDGTFLEG